MRNYSNTTKHGALKGVSNRSVRPPKEYGIWTSMKFRCSNPNHISYKNYGGRGISVCQRWLDSYENFIKDIGPRPSELHSIERIDRDGNYEPENCRWASNHEQHRNTRRTRMITYKSQAKCLTDWAIELKVSFSLLSSRLRKYNGDLEKVIKTLSIEPVATA